MTAADRIYFRDCRAVPDADYVLPGLLRGTVGMLVGAGAVGKSYMALQIGAGVALGQAIGSGPAGDLIAAPTPGGVAIAYGEDPTDEVRRRIHRLMRALAPAEIARLDADTDDGLTIMSTVAEDMRVVQRCSGGYAAGPWLPRLRELVAGKRLLILDPLVYLHDCEENDSGAMGHVMRSIAQVAAAAHTAVLILHHTGKGAGDTADEWQRARGSSALTTAVRVQYDLRGLRESEAAEWGLDDVQRRHWVRYATTKSNYGPPVAPAWARRDSQTGLLACTDPEPTPTERRAVTKRRRTA